MTENTRKDGPDDMQDDVSDRVTIDRETDKASDAPTDGNDDLKDALHEEIEDAGDSSEGPDLLFANIDALMEGSDAPPAESVNLDDHPYKNESEPVEDPYLPVEQPIEPIEETFIPVSNADEYLQESSDQVEDIYSADDVAESDEPESSVDNFFDDLDEQSVESVTPVDETNTAETEPDAPIIELGFYGKLPAYGDFIQKRLPQDFINPWHEWVQTGMLACREHDPENWMTFYLNCPAWCFVLDEGICGEQPVAGVTIPSVDRVGRYFNFTLASILPVGTSPTVFAAARHRWFEDLEKLALTILDQEMDQDGIERLIIDQSAELGWALSSSPAFESDDGHSRIASNDLNGVVGFIPALLHQLISDKQDRYGIWWHRGSSQATAQMLSCAGMPVGETFLGLIMDNEFRDAPQTTTTESDYMDELLSD